MLGTAETQKEYKPGSFQPVFSTYCKTCHFVSPSEKLQGAVLDGQVMNVNSLPGPHTEFHLSFWKMTVFGEDLPAACELDSYSGELFFSLLPSVDSKITGAARKNSVEGGRWGEHAATRLRGRGVTLENEIPVSSEFPMSDSEQTVSN